MANSSEKSTLTLLIAIGDARDGWDNGVITHVNAQAAALGLAPGQRMRDAISRLEWPT